jgi:hypothetical protein
MTVTALPKVRPLGDASQFIRVRAWRQIRHLHSAGASFTLGQLLDVVATGAKPSEPNYLFKYLIVLERHGVLVRLPRRDKSASKLGPGSVIWQLDIDLGWHAPVWRPHKRVLWNPNASAVVALPVPAPLMSPLEDDHVFIVTGQGVCA